MKIKNLKISKNMVKTLAPYVLVAGLSFTGFSLGGMTPFKRNTEKVPLVTKTECDSNGNINETKKYTLNKNNNTATFEGVWQKEDDGTYGRDTIDYNLKSNISKENIENIVIGSDPAYDLDAISNKKNIQKEIKTKLNKEDKKDKPYVIATIYNEDKNDYILTKESTKSMVAKDVLYLMLNGYLDIMILLSRVWKASDEEKAKRYTKKK